jgi:hypothetical protein
MLIQRDAVYQEIAAEKVLGWKSEALNLLWASRKKSFQSGRAGLSSASQEESRKRFTPEEKKYYAFYISALPREAPSVFVRSPRLFVDIGCAPGGLSKFFTVNLNWRGFGFSLPPAEGGLDMRFQNPLALKFAHMNMADVDVWQRVVEVVHDSVNVARDFFPDPKLSSRLARLGRGLVDFINLGVVVDIGQVEQDTGAGSADLTVRSIHVSRNQMLVLLRLLKQGGDAMWIHSLSHVDTFFFFMDYLVDMFESVKVINTLVPSRSPVYVILSKFRGLDHARATQFQHKLLNTPVRYEKPDDWQCSAFSVVERVMAVPGVGESVRNVWRDKAQKLRATRELAEQRLIACAGNKDLFLAKEVGHLMAALSGKLVAPAASASRVDNDHDFYSLTPTAASTPAAGSTPSAEGMFYVCGVVAEERAALLRCRRAKLV